jgi:hypothetical protein
MYHVKNIEDYIRSQRFGDVNIAPPSNRDLDAVNARLVLLKDEQEEFSMQNNILQQNFNDPLGTLVKRETKVPICGTADSVNAINRQFMALGLSTLDTMPKAAVGCPANRRLLLMAVAADCSYVQDKGGRAAALKSILSIWNTVSGVFEDTFNVQLGVAKVIIQENCTPDDPNLRWNRDCDSSYGITNRLSDFSLWRGTQSDNFGLYHLMTKCNTIPSVGIAWLCNQSIYFSNSMSAANG